MMHVPEAWDYSHCKGRPCFGDGMRIGHVDTGVADHLELQPGDPILWKEGYDFIDDVPEGRDPLANTWHLEQIGQVPGRPR